MLQLCCGVCQKPLKREFHFTESLEVIPQYKKECNCNAKSVVYHRVNRQPVCSTTEKK